MKNKISTSKLRIILIIGVVFMIVTGSFCVKAQAPAVFISNVTSPVCVGENLFAQAFPVNGGVNPSFQWYINGTPLNAFTSILILPITNQFYNNGALTCRMTPQGGNQVSSPPAFLTIFDDPDVSTPSVTNVTCMGVGNGMIDLSITGGTMPYFYSWSNSATTQNISNLGPGLYSVTVTDLNTCTTTAAATVTEPPILAANAIATPVACNGSAGGVIDLTVSGGTAPYNFSWSNGSITEDLINIPAGNYSGTVTDANGCMASEMVTVSEPTAIMTSASSINILCNGESTGSINLTVSGGIAPYTISWSNGATTEDLSNIPAGSYFGTVTDANGCIASATVTITEPAAIMLSTTSVDAACAGSNTGAIDLTVSGGSAPYTFGWSNGATSEDLNGISSGSYSLTVTDVNGCTATTMASIIEPAAIIVSATSANVLCNGESTGSIDLVVTGGTLPYAFSWSNGATTEDLSSLPAGSYTVTVTDANGCNTGTTVTIAEQTGIMLSATSVDVLCSGDSTGSVDLTVAGGTSPYTFNWSNAAMTEDLTGLMMGIYTVTVTDLNGCIAMTSDTIEGSPQLLTSSLVVSAVSCNGFMNGSIDLTIAGSSGPINYQWSNGAATQDINGLAAGIFNVVISDTFGCSISDTATITEPSKVIARIDSFVIPDGCSETGNGLIEIGASGDFPSFTYSLVSGTDTLSNTNGEFSGIDPGNYALFATDSTGCRSEDTVLLIKEKLPIGAGYVHHDGAFNIPFGNGDGVWSAMTIFDAAELDTFYGGLFKSVSFRMNGTSADWGAVILRIREGVEVSGTDSVASIIDFGNKVFEMNITGQLGDNPKGFSCIGVEQGCVLLQDGQSYGIEVQIAPLSGMVPEMGVDAGPTKEGKGGWFINSEYPAGRQMGFLRIPNIARNWNIRARIGSMIDCQPTSVIEPVHEINTIRLFPVPADQFLNIHFETSTENSCDIAFYDLLGKLVLFKKSMPIQADRMTHINTEKLPNGVYLVSIRSGSDDESRKILIMHNE